jgi:hypothetical protein
MATREIYHNSINYTGSDTIASNIATLRTNIVSGAIPTASDHNTLISMINNMLGHYHNYNDQYQIATYGNNGDRGTYSESKNSNPPAYRPGNTGTVDTSTVITAARHNLMKDGCNFLRSHFHQIDDRTG